MQSKNQWTSQEDQILKKYTQNQTKKNWVLISQQLNERFTNKKRTAKQCRERYVNHASFPDQNKNQWSQEQCQKLFTVFDQVGPKWSKIATQFKGKGQNCVKNKFYSCIRKLVRKMNNFQSVKKEKKNKKLKYESIFRVLQASESIRSLTQQFKQRVLSLRHQIVQFLFETTIFIQQDIVLLIREINKFNLDSRSYKQERNKIHKSNIRLQPKIISHIDSDFLENIINQDENKDNLISAEHKNFIITQNSQIQSFQEVLPSFQLSCGPNQIQNENKNQSATSKFSFLLDDEMIELNIQEQHRNMQNKQDSQLIFHDFFENQKNFMGF